MRFFILILLFLFCVGLSQESLAQEQLKTWSELIKEPVVRFADVQAAYERAYAEDPDEEYDQYYRWVTFVRPYLDADGVYDAMREQAILLAARQQRDKAAVNKAAIANWQLLGPIGPPGPTNWNNYSVGRIDAIAFHPTDANTFYAGSPTGGLWKTTNGGTSWAFLSQSWPSLGVSDIAVDPTNPNIVYVATGDRDSWNASPFGIQKSTDGGNTWTTLPLSAPLAYRYYRLIINPTATNTLLLATNAGIYKTTNGGANWVLAYGAVGTSTIVQDIEFKPGDPTTVYAVSGGRFFKSSDGGTSFAEISGTAFSGSNSQRTGIAVTAAAPNQVIVATATSTLEGIYRSTDSGASFTKITSATSSVSTNSGSSPITSFVSQTGYTWSLAVSPVNADEIWLGTLYIIKTTNGGANWQYVDGNVHVDVHALEFQPGTNRLFTGSDGGINRSPVSGTGNFDILHNGMSISQIYRIGGVANAAGPVYMGLQDNGVVRYNNSAFTIQMIGDGMESVIDPTNPSVIYACRQQGNINKTVNGGTAWVNITPNPTPVGALWTIPLIMNPTNPQILLAGYEQVYKSTNGGTSWTQSGVVPGSGTGSVSVIRYAPSNPAIIYAGRSGSLAVSTNGGDSWSALTLPSTSFLLNDITVSSVDPARLWISIRDYANQSKNRLLTSANGGATWSDYTGSLPNVPMRSIVYQNNTNNGLYVATDAGIYYRNATLACRMWRSMNWKLPMLMVESCVRLPTGAVCGKATSMPMVRREPLPLH